MKAGRLRRVPGQPRVTPRGATRKPARGRNGAGRGRRWLKWLPAVLVAALLGVALKWAAEPVAGWLNRPVAEVGVKGNFRYLRRERAEALLSEQLGEGFLQLDLGAIKRTLESEPWVERAALSRQWPDRLEVTLYEEEPIARWGDTGFLNRRGDIVEVAEPSALEALPLLEGADRDAARMMERYQALSSLLRPRGLTIQSLSRDRKNAWQLTLKDGVTLMIGRDRVLEKMQRFVLVYDGSLSERWDQVKEVDVRYHSGVAVAWTDESGNDNDE